MLPIPAIPTDPALRLVFVASLVVTACAAAVLGAVLWNFLTARHDAERRERRSPVETGSMLLFTFGFYLLIRRDIGELPFPAYPVHLTAVLVGLVLMIAGTVVNILGRLALGGNWANQVTIYTEQTLVTGGVYGLVRHPLYASLIWMFHGAALVYLNWAALLAVLLIFVPMMTFRAKQEETALTERFLEYAAYQRAVGRLMPKVGARHGANAEE